MFTPQEALKYTDTYEYIIFKPNCVAFAIKLKFAQIK